MVGKEMKLLKGCCKRLMTFSHKASVRSMKHFQVKYQQLFSAFT